MNYNDYGFYPVRASAVLTTSYVAGQILGLGTAVSGTVDLKNQLIMYVHFTKGSLTTAELIVEFSHDGSTNWVQETYDDIAASTGVITQRAIVRSFGASGDYRIALPMNDQHVRISVKGTGTVTSSLMAIDAIIGNN